jgi:hypothetical protein
MKPYCKPLLTEFQFIPPSVERKSPSPVEHPTKIFLLLTAIHFIYVPSGTPLQRIQLTPLSDERKRPFPIVPAKITESLAAKQVI